jgi:hypothetical protein
MDARQVLSQIGQLAGGAASSASCPSLLPPGRLPRVFGCDSSIARNASSRLTRKWLRIGPQRTHGRPREQISSPTVQRTTCARNADEHVEPVQQQPADMRVSRGLRGVCGGGGGVGARTVLRACVAEFPPVQTETVPSFALAMANRARWAACDSGSTRRRSRRSQGKCQRTATVKHSQRAAVCRKRLNDAESCHIRKLRLPRCTAVNVQGPRQLVLDSELGSGCRVALGRSVPLRDGRASRGEWAPRKPPKRNSGRECKCGTLGRREDAGR